VKNFEGLVDSDYFFIEDPRLIAEDYLYRSSTGIHPFALFQEQLEQINDYCVFVIKRTDEYIAELKTDEHECLASPKYGEITDDVLMGLTEFIIPTWEYNKEVFLKTTMLVLIFSFVEYCLKTVCLSLQLDLEMNDNRKSKIDTYLEKINQCTNNNLKLTTLCKKRLFQGRRVRNLFAHGDWDSIMSELKRGSLLRDYIDMVVEILYNVETKLVQYKLIDIE